MAMLDALELSECLTNPSFADTQTAIAKYERQMFRRFAEMGQGTLFNTEWMHQPHALDDMLTMFSKNVFRQGIFIGKMWLNVTFIPFIRKTMGLSPRQNIFKLL